jgi:beta-glucosidase
LRQGILSILTCLLGVALIRTAPRSDLPADARPGAPALGARQVRMLTVDGLSFKDLDKNGRLDVYEDWRRPVEARVADLVSRMTLPEKAGLMIHSSLSGFMGPGGSIRDAPPASPPAEIAAPRHADVLPLDRPAPGELILERNVRWILLRSGARDAPEDSARFANGLQEIAEGSRLGIPVVLSSDPRHSARRISGKEPVPPASSCWPDPIGFAAIGDPATVREFGRLAAREYRALGLRTTLSPMADLATEPRWNRVRETFGEDVRLAAALVKAQVEGFQGPRLGPESVLAITKHWPGDGPVKDGQDPHNEYGKWLVYPGRQFERHLIPFEAAFQAGTAGVMGGYGIPQGLDTVGINFSKRMIAEELRGRHHYQGVVVTDWLRNMPWGVEGLTEKERQRRIVEAGVDQIGGDNDPRYIVELVREARVPQSRIDESAARILRPMFQLGLFENPYVDAERAPSMVATREAAQAGEAAQRRSIVLLKNAKGLLPLAGRPKLYVENLSREAAARYGTLVDDPREAAVALIAVDAPYALHPGPEKSFFRGSHEGTLAYAGAENAAQLDAVKKLVASGTPTVVCIYLERPAVLTELIDDAAAVLAHFNSSPPALLDVVFGRSSPGGRLPFDLPRDMASVLRQKEDVPHDLENPLFRLGHGLLYEQGTAEVPPRGLEGGRHAR